MALNKHCGLYSILNDTPASLATATTTAAATAAARSCIHGSQPPSAWRIARSAWAQQILVASSAASRRCRLALPCTNSVISGLWLHPVLPPTNFILSYRSLLRLCLLTRYDLFWICNMMRYIKIRYTELRNTEIRYIKIRYSKIRDIKLRNNKIRYIKICYIKLRYINSRYIELRNTKIRYIKKSNIKIRYTLGYVTLSYVMLRYITLRYVTFRLITSLHSAT